MAYKKKQRNKLLEFQSSLLDIMVVFYRINSLGYSEHLNFSEQK